MSKQLKLIARYDAARNEYTLHRHNLTPEEANEAVRELAARLFGLFVIDQRTRHSAEDLDECRACRHDMREKAHVEPEPKFKRRQL